MISNNLKEIGNKNLQDGHYMEALDHYTKAIDIDPQNAILYANRSLAHIKLETFGCAIDDATMAIKLDPNYSKAYFRRADAYWILNKFTEALEDFKIVLRLSPNDAFVRKKFQDCKKAFKRYKFSQAISSEHTQKTSETVDLKSLEISSTYDGPSIKDSEGITLKFIEEMIEHFKKQKYLAQKTCYQILLTVLPILSKQETLVEIKVPESACITVCGDTHGQFYDLLNIFKLNGFPSEKNWYLFNGDFVDRGSFSCEVILTLLSFKCIYYDYFYLARGNHESLCMNKRYGFEGEVKHKYNEKTFDIFQEIFCALPLAHVINSKILVVHGGLSSQDGTTLEDIKKIYRFCEPPMQGTLMSDILWSDPQTEPGRGPSKRGLGTSFGPDVTKKFLNENGLEMVIRSHEVKQNGYEIEVDGKLVTVFSAPNYCDIIGNLGGYIRINHLSVPQYFSFAAVPHPPVPVLAYAT